MDNHKDRAANPNVPSTPNISSAPKNKRGGSQTLSILREGWAHWRYFEYWPTRLFYAPIYPLIAYYALRFRSLQFMAMVNPCMEFGGLLNYSKSQILERLPQDKLLRACLVSAKQELPEVWAQMAASGLEFPIIAKPDCGERGFAVELIRSREALADYLSRFRELSADLQSEHEQLGHTQAEQQIILQEYFHPAKEFAVLYSVALPHEREKLGQIRSISAKEPLVVCGDGRSPLWQLVAGDARAAQRFSLLRRKWQQRWHEVLAAGQSLQLTEIGAHSLGTTCYSLEHIPEQERRQLLEIFAKLGAAINSGVELQASSESCPAFCFGRYDILAKDWDSVLAGNFKVIELNGVNAEPIHIYQPNYSLWRAWKTLWSHWKRIALLAKEMQARGTPLGSSRQLLQAIREHDKRIKQFEKSKGA